MVEAQGGARHLQVLSAPSPPTSSTASLLSISTLKAAVSGLRANPYRRDTLVCFNILALSVGSVEDPTAAAIAGRVAAASQNATQWAELTAPLLSAIAASQGRPNASLLLLNGTLSVQLIPRIPLAVPPERTWMQFLGTLLPWAPPFAASMLCCCFVLACLWRRKRKREKKKAQVHPLLARKGFTELDQMEARLMAELQEAMHLEEVEEEEEEEEEGAGEGEGEGEEVTLVKQVVETPPARREEPALAGRDSLEIAAEEGRQRSSAPTLPSSFPGSLFSRPPTAPPAAASEVGDAAAAQPESLVQRALAVRDKARTEKLSSIALQEAVGAAAAERTARLERLELQRSLKRTEKKYAELKQAPLMKRLLLVKPVERKWWSGPRATESKIDAKKWTPLVKEVEAAKANGEVWPPPDTLTMVTEHTVINADGSVTITRGKEKLKSAVKRVAAKLRLGALTGMGGGGGGEGGGSAAGSSGFLGLLRAAKAQAESGGSAATGAPGEVAEGANQQQQQPALSLGSLFGGKSVQGGGGLLGRLSSPLAAAATKGPEGGEGAAPAPLPAAPLPSAGPANGMLAMMRQAKASAAVAAEAAAALEAAMESQAAAERAQLEKEALGEEDPGKLPGKR